MNSLRSLRIGLLFIYVNVVYVGGRLNDFGWIVSMQYFEDDDWAW